MPAFSRLSVDELVSATNTLYVNARDTPEIAEALARYKITPEMLDHGVALRQALVDAARARSAEEADAARATAVVQDLAAEVRDGLTVDRDLARLDHPRGSDGYRALKLAGSPPADRDAMLGLARRFYGTAQDRPDLAAPVPSLSPESITAALALVADAETADAAQDKEEGEAQRATSVRDAAADALRAHASRTAAVADRALADRPQLRELLGLLERS